MSDLFISYSRRDGDVAHRLHDAFASAGRDVWIDWEDIPPTAEWLTEIEQAIEASDAFVFLLSPDSVASPVCRREIDAAEKLGKRLVPVVCREVMPEAVPDALARLNWIFLTEGRFEAGVSQLATALETDLEWVREHTRLSVRAGEWERDGCNRSLLLRGTDLRRAEDALAGDPTREPQATELQHQFARESRRAQVRTSRQIVTASVVAVGVALALAAFAFYQQGVAEERTRVAQSRLLAADANSALGVRQDLALLLAVRSWQTAPTPAAEAALIGSVLHQPRLRRFIHDHDAAVTAIAYSEDNRWLVTGDDRGGALLHDLKGGEPSVWLPGLRSSIYSLRADTERGVTTILAQASQSAAIRVWPMMDARWEIHKWPSIHIETEPDAAGRFGSVERVYEEDGAWSHLEWFFRGLQLHVRPGRLRDASVVTTHPTEPLFAIGFDSGEVELWRLQLPSREQEAVDPESGEAACKPYFNIDGASCVATVALEESIDLGSGAVSSLAFSPDSTTLVVGLASGLVSLVEIGNLSGLERRLLPEALEARLTVPSAKTESGEMNPFESRFAISADGRRFAAPRGLYREREGLIEYDDSKPDGWSEPCYDDFGYASEEGLEQGYRVFHQAAWFAPDGNAFACASGSTRSIPLADSIDRVEVGPATLLYWNLLDPSSQAVSHPVDAKAFFASPNADPFCGPEFFALPEGTIARFTPLAKSSAAPWPVELEFDVSVRAIECTPSGTRAFVSLTNGSLVIVDRAHPGDRRTLSVGTRVIGVSQDGERWLAEEGLEYVVWQLGETAPQRLATLITQASGIDLSPDGRWVATQSTSRGARGPAGRLSVWDAERGGRLVEIPVDTGIDGFAALQFVNDPHPAVMVMPSAGPPARFDLAAETWVDRACRLAGRDLAMPERSAYLGVGVASASTCSAVVPAPPRRNALDVRRWVAETVAALVAAPAGACRHYSEWYDCYAADPERSGVAGTAPAVPFLMQAPRWRDYDAPPRRSESFRHYNAPFIHAATDLLAKLAEDDEFATKVRGVYAARLRSPARDLLAAHRAVFGAPERRAVERAYVHAIDTMFEAARDDLEAARLRPGELLRDAFPNALPLFPAPLDATPEYLFESAWATRGFWVRRSVDGSAAELHRALLTLMKIADPEALEIYRRAGWFAAPAGSDATRNRPRPESTEPRQRWLETLLWRLAQDAPAMRNPLSVSTLMTRYGGELNGLERVVGAPAFVGWIDEPYWGHPRGRKDDFRHYNSEFVSTTAKLVLGLLEKSPAAALLERAYETQFRYNARRLLEAHRVVFTSDDRASVTAEYQNAMRDGESKMDAPIAVLRNAFPDTRPLFPSEPTLDKLSRVPAWVARGFWIRRSIDGSADELHRALVTLMDLVDPEALEVYRSAGGSGG